MFYEISMLLSLCTTDSAFTECHSDFEFKLRIQTANSDLKIFNFPSAEK